jgi:cytochrome c peroxidase
VPPHYTDANIRLHAPAEVGTDPLLAQRGTTGKYRTTPLRGLWQHPPYFHNGSAATLEAVVDHYIRVLGLSLKPQQRRDLVQFLRSL